jgi:hypothetical protein
VNEHFTTITVCDFEYEIAGGELPKVLCMVAHVLDENLRHVRTIKIWRGEFGTAPPFDIGPDALFVAYSAWAEMTCFKVLGWKFPEHVLRLSRCQQYPAALRSGRNPRSSTIGDRNHFHSVRLVSAGIGHHLRRLASRPHA